MNLCDKITLQLIENAILVHVKDRATYEEETHSFPTFDLVVDFLRDYWDYELKEQDLIDDPSPDGGRDDAS